MALYIPISSGPLTLLYHFLYRNTTYLSYSYPVFTFCTVLASCSATRNSSIRHAIWIYGYTQTTLVAMQQTP
ncbi:hypothetical protein MTR_5g045270 [Medicago truncatula]|uniref:Uncharacterized protein n=1 Tax=Medicago truncatula TaxID=3880 RepID=G7JZ16_MEDTR|nr:hypothetical protein MTR_5g045270 [Medicago truncatula]